MAENMNDPNTTDRDLGTVGGGSIPGSKSASNDSAGDRGTTGTGSITDPGDGKDRDKSAAASNTIDKHAQANTGGRDPSQPQTSMGDRDSRSDDGGRAGMDVTDPMTSRDPSQINQNPPKDSEQKS